MKTFFLSFSYSFLLILAFLNPTNVFATDTPEANQNDPVVNNFDDFESDPSLSYAARIQRFHHSQKGLDYFDPNYTGEIADKIEFQRIRGNRNLSPYNFSYFQRVARFSNSFVIWRYINDEHYRKIIDHWNNNYNIYWTYTISPSTPFGTFDFTGDRSNENVVIYRPCTTPYYLHLLRRPNQYRASSYYNYNYINRRNYANRQTANTNTPLIGITKLPTRVPQETVVVQQTIETPNFTKHVPITVGWSRGQGISKSNENSRAFSRGSNTRTFNNNNNNNNNNRNSNRNTSLSRFQQNAVNNSQYNNLATSNKANTVNTSASTSSNQSVGQSAPKTSSNTATTNNN